MTPCHLVGIPAAFARKDCLHQESCLVDTELKHKGQLTFYQTTEELRGLSPRANYTDRTIGEVSANSFADRWCHVVSVTDPYGRIFGFVDRIRYCLFQVAPQL
jgi:hypothetical protein